MRKIEKIHTPNYAVFQRKANNKSIIKAVATVQNYCVYPRNC